MYPIYDLDSDPMTDSSYSLFDDSYAGSGYRTDATDENSTAATSYFLTDATDKTSTTAEEAPGLYVDDWFDNYVKFMDGCNNYLTTTMPASLLDDDFMTATTLIELQSYSLPGNVDEDEDGDYSVSDFINEMGANALSWTTPASNCWLFWSKRLPQTNYHRQSNSIPEKIKSVLSDFMLQSTGKVLAQFWTTKIITGRRTLTTLDQPFGVYGIDREFCGFVKKCLDYQIDVNSEIDDDLGVPGRVFRNAWPEVTPDVKSYSLQEYPLRDSALLAGVKRSLALPIFESCDRGCVGVLEILDAEENFLYVDVLAKVHLALKMAKLETSYMSFNDDMHTQKCPPHTAAEIQKILDVVGAKHKLPLAQIWGTRSYSNAVSLDLAKRGNSFRVKCAEVASTYSMPYYERDAIKTSVFRMSCKEHLIKKGQGIVGNILVDYNPYFCRDVAQVSTTKYPFSICARNSGLSSCFAICLDNIYDASELYVLELFLPPCNATLLESIFTTVKQHLWNFKVSSGAEGDELSIKVIKLSLNDEVDSFKLNISGISATSSKILNEKEEQLDSSSFQVTEAPSTLNVQNVERNVSRICSMNTYFGANSSDKKHEDTELSISYEAIKQQFGRNLADAAESLDVSRSTLKRICRKHHILRWPSSKRKKGNNFLTNCSTKCIHEFHQGVKGQIPESGARDSLDSTPPKEATEAIAPVKDKTIVNRLGNNVTVKAFYKDEIIKFTLSLASGMTKLVENVAKRLNLEAEIVRLRFEDDDGDMITITCDENVQELFGCSRSRGRAIIKVSIKQDLCSRSSSPKPPRPHQVARRS